VSCGKNGRTDRDAVWGMTRVGPETCADGDKGAPRDRGNVLEQAYALYDQLHSNEHLSRDRQLFLL